MWQVRLKLIQGVVWTLKHGMSVCCRLVWFETSLILWESFVMVTFVWKRDEGGVRCGVRRGGGQDRPGSPVLQVLGPVQQVRVARWILFYNIFNVVRLQRLSKSLACDKILELHGNRNSLIFLVWKGGCLRRRRVTQDKHNVEWERGQPFSGNYHINRLYNDFQITDYVILALIR